MVNPVLEFILLVLTVIFSFTASVFGFLRWRASVTTDIEEHERILRYRYENTDKGYEVPMPSESDSEVDKYLITLSDPTCRAKSDLYSRIYASIFDENGSTTATLQFSELKKSSQIYPMRSEEISDWIDTAINHPWYSDLEIVLSPPDRNITEIKFKTTDPEMIESKISDLIKIFQQIVVNECGERPIMVKQDEA